MSENNTIVVEIQYLPGLEFWTCYENFETILLEKHEHFQKQTFRNRCQILTAQGVDTLVVPVLDGRSKHKTLIQDVKIDYHQPWMKRHWGAIEAAYRKTPFFEYFEEKFRKVYEQKPDFLYDLNRQMLTVCQEFLRVPDKCKDTETYNLDYKWPITDARGLILPKKGPEERGFYQPIPYRQNFGEQFFPNLSILDLLFCQGNKARSILKASIKNTSTENTLTV